MCTFKFPVRSPAYVDLKRIKDCLGDVLPLGSWELGKPVWVSPEKREAYIVFSDQSFALLAKLACYNSN